MTREHQKLVREKNALEVYLISIAYSITENPSIPLNISIQNLAQYKLALSRCKGYQKNNALSFLPQAKFCTQKILFWPRPRIPALEMQCILR